VSIQIRGQEVAVNNHILIVDNMEAFATILKEGIEGGGDYEASVATTAIEARNEAERGHLAMVIVDMGLEDEDPVELLKTLRERHPELRLMAIPIDDLPDEVYALGLQGTLPKPFFLPDIPAQIEAAMTRSVGALPEEEPEPEVEVVAEEPAEPEEPAPAEAAKVAPTPAAPAPAMPAPSPELLAHLASESHRLADHLRHLSRELNAEAVMLTCGDELIAYAGQFARAEAERLARTVSASWQASAQVAIALGREKVRFEQSLHESEDYLLYSLAAVDNGVLSVALRADRPLGMIRYNTKQTAEALGPILLPR
jgi:DNA-binding NarL/FixJ family response regulator/predicted regulator of Ras-like GTPase activity (Roadblock/LC7/MglB family)